MNCFNFELLSAFGSALKTINFNPELRAVIITGAAGPGKPAFSAGADLAERRTMPDNDVRRFIHTINSAITELENLNLPALAAINGFAFGGGLELALVCDLRVASSGAVMGLTETSLAVTRGWGLANVLAAMQAGIDIFEGCYEGIGGQPANFVDGVPVAGTGKYYYQDPSWVGLATLEDMVVMMDEMGIELGLDVDKVLDIGRMVERIVGRPLRSESIRQGRVLKGPRKDFSR